MGPLGRWLRGDRRAVSTRAAVQKLKALPFDAPLPDVYDAGPIDPGEARRLFEEFEASIEISEKEARTALKHRIRSAVESPGERVPA